ncbi:hypothetical protein ABIB29_000840 [Arthrobacter sp. UYEF36]
MSRPRPILGGLIALGAATGLMTGCSTASSPQENESKVCAATTAYASALTRVLA